MPDVDAFALQCRAHLVSGGVLASASPKGRRTAEPSCGHGRVRRHAAADRRIFETPDLLAAAANSPSTRQTRSSADKPRQTSFTPFAHAASSAAAVVLLVARAGSLQHLAVFRIEQMHLSRLRRSDRRSPTLGRSAGSIRAIAGAPARSK